MRQQCVMNIHQSSAYLEEEIIKINRKIDVLDSKMDKECNTIANGIQPILNFKWGEPNTRNGIVKRLHKNTDVSGSLNILKKVVGNFDYDPIEVCSTPSVYTVKFN